MAAEKQIRLLAGCDGRLPGVLDEGKTGSVTDGIVNALSDVAAHNLWSHCRIRLEGGSSTSDAVPMLLREKKEKKRGGLVPHSPASNSTYVNENKRKCRTLLNEPIIRGNK